MGLYEASSTRRNQNRSSQYPHRDGERMRRSIYPWRELLSAWRVRDAPNQTMQPKHHHQSSAPARLVLDLEVRHPRVGPARRSKGRFLTRPSASRCANWQQACRNIRHMPPPPDARRRMNWNRRKRPSDRSTVTAALHTAPPKSTHPKGMILEPWSCDPRFVAMPPL
jgi:hypothetical protein